VRNLQDSNIPQRMTPIPLNTPHHLVLPNPRRHNLALIPRALRRRELHIVLIDLRLRATHPQIPLLLRRLTRVRRLVDVVVRHLLLLLRRLRLLRWWRHSDGLSAVRIVSRRWVPDWLSGVSVLRSWVSESLLWRGLLLVVDDVRHRRDFGRGRGRRRLAGYWVVDVRAQAVVGVVAWCRDGRVLEVGGVVGPVVAVTAAVVCVGCGHVGEWYRDVGRLRDVLSWLKVGRASE